VTVVDLFSKRQRRLRGEVPDVYTYTQIPGPLRVQIVHLWLAVLGRATDYGRADEAYRFLVETLRREYGVFQLPGGDPFRDHDLTDEFIRFFLNEPDVERALDGVELSFRLIDRFTRDFSYLHRSDASERADEAIRDLNARFREHGVGYQYVDGEIMRVDSDLIHSEVVKPAIRLLNRKGYDGAREEFLKAHQHYRNGQGKEALNECLKSLESVIKAICDKRGWQYGPTATSKELIEVCFSKGLVPSFWQGQYAALRSLLESSVPTGRNRLGGHGQGAVPVAVPDHLIAYMLHMTASAIVFLTEAEASV
jgi:hypothetical protein